MQTMIQIDEAVLAQATKLAREKGCDLSRFIKETLRDKLAPLSPVSTLAFSPLVTIGGHGVYPGVDLNNSSALLAKMEQGE